MKSVGRLRPLLVLLGLFVGLSTVTRGVLLLQEWAALDAGPRLLWESYPLPLILGALFALDVVLIVSIRKFIDGSIGPPDASPFWRVRGRVGYGAALAALPALSFAFVNVSMTGISANNFANELAGNGIYDFGAAFRNNELDFDRFYATREKPHILAGLRGLLREPQSRYVNDDPMDITREVRRDGTEKRGTTRNSSTRGTATSTT